MQHDTIDDSYDEDAHVDEHDDGHDAHPTERAGWVLIPLLVGLVLGLAVLVYLGLDSGAKAFVR